MDIATLNSRQTPQDVYDAIMEAAQHGLVEQDASPDGNTLITILHSQKPKKGDKWVTGRMFRWWVPRHGGGTRLVATAGIP